MPKLVNVPNVEPLPRDVYNYIKTDCHMEYVSVNDNARVMLNTQHWVSRSVIKVDNNGSVWVAKWYHTKYSDKFK